MCLYRALKNNSSVNGINEAHALCGFELGNQWSAGCLSDKESSRIHSCEPGISCPATRSPDTVFITPIVNRTLDGTEVPELGAGGGAGDLYQVHELELPDESTLAELEKLCLQHIHDKRLLSQTRDALAEAFRSRKKTLSLDRCGVQEEDEISLEQFVTRLSSGLSDTGYKATEPSPTNRIVSYSRFPGFESFLIQISAFRTHDIPHTLNCASL